MKKVYKATHPYKALSHEGNTNDSPIMDSRDMELWLNGMAKDGWEFVSYGAKHWNNGLIQDWWIFCREEQ